MARAEVQVGDVLLARDDGYRVDGMTLNGPGPDEGHLDGQVVKAARLHPGRVPSGPALDLEDPDRVGLAQQVVDASSWGSWAGRPRPRGTGPPGRPCGVTPRACPTPAGRTSPARWRRSRPCPTAARCVRACAPLDGQTSITGGRTAPCPRNGYPGDADVQHLGGQLGHQRWNPLAVATCGRTGRTGRPTAAPPPRPPPPPVDPVDPRRPPIHLLGVNPKALPRRARRNGTVGDDVGHLRRVTPAVPFVHVLDDLFTPAGLDVDVDVRGPSRAGTGTARTAAQVDGVDVGDPEA